ncbi:MAG: hypothetical protein J6Y02_19150 [Pseudobutyrivibrio sp.]|nr:hypothetical protein [Pseudobutyrivibrio sp.]
MANPLFNELNGPQSMPGQFAEFMQNPILYLMKRKNVQIPEQYSNNPQEAVNYLVSSGQMDQQTLNNLRSKASQMGYKF